MVYMISLFVNTMAPGIIVCQYYGMVSQHVNMHMASMSLYVNIMAWYVAIYHCMHVKYVLLPTLVCFH